MDPATTVPGRLARQALTNDGAYESLEPRLKLYPDLRALLKGLTTVSDPGQREVEKGEVQLAFMLASQAAQSQEVAVVYAVESELVEPLRYQLCAARDQGSLPQVQALLRYLAEDNSAQLTLESFGYMNRGQILAPPKTPDLDGSGS
jgi:ABC-type molybdate transport system substrate-binding protein